MKVIEILPEGIASAMQHINAERVAQIFDEQEIADFDAYFLSAQGEREASYELNWSADKKRLDAYISAILDRYWKNWVREKKALEADYDLLWTGGGDVKTTETRHEQGTNKDSAQVQNKLNAYNGTDASDTDSQNREGEGEHDITTTIEHSTERKENSVTYTQAEVVEKELNLRMKYKFFEIVEADIARECCSPIFQ